MAAVPADVFIDNLSVTRGGRRAWSGQPHIPRRQPAAWRAISEQAQHLACRIYACAKTHVATAGLKVDGATHCTLAAL